MRITEGQLRRIIREELLSEVPLIDIIPSDISQNPPHRRRASIAHTSARSHDDKYADEKYVEIAKGLMRTARDNWVIITPNDVSDRTTIHTDDFLAWLNRNRDQHPPGTIFAYASAASFPNDERTPDWNIVHDLFGHTLEMTWKRQVAPGPTGGPGFVPGSAIAAKLHRKLPRRYRISSNDQDMLPDVLAAILLEVLSPETAHEAIEEGFASHSPEQLSYVHEQVDSMFRVVEKWLGRAREDRFVELAPW